MTDTAVILLPTGEKRTGTEEFSPFFPPRCSLVSEGSSR